MVIKEKIAVSVEIIDPTTALRYLDSMDRNRSLSQPGVDRWARAMEAGDWIPEANGPIRFDTDGKLIDGQHRLWALATTGLSLPFIVVRGVPPAGLYVIDINKRRTLADALHIHGETNSQALAGTINLYTEYLYSGMVQKAHRVSEFTVAAALAVLDNAPGLRESIKPGFSIRRHFQGGPGRWATIHFILCDIDTEDAEAFFSQLITGEGLHQAHPILHLRKRLLDDAVALRKLPIRDYSALIFKAWNMWRTGKTTPRSIGWKGGGRNPEAYPIPE
jgi:hypothetical protein